MTAAALLITLFAVAGICQVTRGLMVELVQQEREARHRDWESHEGGMRQVAESLERLSLILIYHDATVRGRNPETLGSTEELLRLLSGKSHQS